MPGTSCNATCCIRLLLPPENVSGTAVLVSVTKKTLRVGALMVIGSDAVPDRVMTVAPYVPATTSTRSPGFAASAAA